MNDNIVNIEKKDMRVSIRNDEIMVNCKRKEDVDDCVTVLDAILNKGESVVSIDYMDFINESGAAKYDFELIKNIDYGNFLDHISKTSFNMKCKYIVCIVGNISFANATDIMKNIIDVSDEGYNQSIVFGFIYDGKQQENGFDMYMWKEV